MTTDIFCFYLQNRLIQTSQAGGQWYSDTSPFSIPCAMIGHDTNRTNQGVHAIVLDSVTLSSLVDSFQANLANLNKPLLTLLVNKLECLAVASQLQLLQSSLIVTTNTWDRIHNT